MTTQIRTTLLTGLFFFGLLTGLQAQDKYEYAVISYNTVDKTLAISINGKEHKKIEVPKTEVTSNADATPALKEVNKMSEVGWEVYNSNGCIVAQTVQSIYYFFLKKKVV